MLRPFTSPTYAAKKRTELLEYRLRVIFGKSNASDVMHIPLTATIRRLHAPTGIQPADLLTDSRLVHDHRKRHHCVGGTTRDDCSRLNDLVLIAATIRRVQCAGSLLRPRVR